MFAKVVIDIKHEEVNQLYDYIVPQTFEDFLVRGMRVIVPFGHMERLGVVVSLHEISDTATKEIKEVLDLIPTLDDEAFAMLDVISKGSPELISALYQTVIPPELLVGYQKVARIIDENHIPEDLKPFFSKRGIWRLKVMDHVYYPRLKRLKDLGHISIETEIKEKKTEKWKTVYTYNLDHNYPKMHLYPMIEDLKHHENSVEKQALYDIGLTDSMIKTLVKHGVLIEEKISVKREIAHVYDQLNRQFQLTSEQKNAINQIKSVKDYHVFLLKGVTGSGKTEVYVNVMEDIIKHQGKVLILVPEIQLIPQMAQYLTSRFDKVAIYHSGLSKGERYDQYQMIINNEADVILGTRSAIFLPIKNLKMIIMDEEHDESYIQKEGVYYDTKTLVLAKASYHNIPVILGSATPSVTSIYYAEQNMYTLVELTKRPKGLPMPKLSYVDMKEELKAKHYAIFSRPLIQGIEDRLQKKEQVILFLNRKGYAPFVMCRACGDVPKCPHCDVSLAFYKDKKIIKCPYCGFEQPFEQTCSVCKEPKMKEVGVGIEYVEEQLKKTFPKARVLRMDKQEIRTKHAHELIWNEFREEEADILIGTQMVTKGLDFPKVTLVGVLIADMLLKVPSYQATEKTFMMLKQVTGRSGRLLHGEAIIQGYDLGHFAIQTVDQDDSTFYKEALLQRKMLGYPPFTQTSQLLFSGSSFLKTYQKAFLMKKEVEKLGFTVLGPAQAMIKKIKDQYRFTLTLKYKEKPLENLFSLINRFKTDDMEIKFLPTLDLW
ncbi:MAG: primosomal protein N' [Tenericutes bacterium GWC2_34_14]|nr:MAG: primosomal protein N' [Tenericutes bacterium GWC2_34_14]OHE33864.1 MAG: primosomal protein N' [Tenericutes bacterium GWE2_34_108]OHE36599.1 MAG: primosomal protein N' [Tenericutes bacterium GWF1_35_14]OHE37825.1 MAG: primosomal protein N' [Tenericutes bacterium GWF2_35_184]OHE45280.1 MAG: primosomal protein N' [Tenericutes bacterium RIFOXYA2_FULL_36_32]OHE45948.1 MAG: primosomal protein N' [Tenericutes bacterium RIFOXYA12_FULL_35_10]OHE50118.1 MAG: primosomal protein N' [Tenericutes b